VHEDAVDNSLYSELAPVVFTFVYLIKVSHHPPISAFYVECGAHRISFNGHIYTKSSFLGVSVAVHNIGQSTLSMHSRLTPHKYIFVIYRYFTAFFLDRITIVLFSSSFLIHFHGYAV
jgi:hypothetical protein